MEKELILTIENPLLYLAPNSKFTLSSGNISSSSIPGPGGEKPE